MKKCIKLLCMFTLFFVLVCGVHIDAQAKTKKINKTMCVGERFNDGYLGSSKGKKNIIKSIKTNNPNIVKVKKINKHEYYIEALKPGKAKVTVVAFTNKKVKTIYNLTISEPKFKCSISYTDGEYYMVKLKNNTPKVGFLDARILCTFYDIEGNELFDNVVEFYCFGPKQTVYGVSGFYDDMLELAPLIDYSKTTFEVSSVQTYGKEKVKNVSQKVKMKTKKVTKNGEKYLKLDYKLKGCAYFSYNVLFFDKNGKYLEGRTLCDGVEDSIEYIEWPKKAKTYKVYYSAIK